MPVHNAEIEHIFDTLADLLEIEGANAFRVRAYRNAARVVGSQSQSMADMLANGKDLTRLPGIGEDLAGKIKTIVETGRLPLLEEVEERTPEALSYLTKISGLGPKRVKTLYQELKIDSLEDLERAVDAGRIHKLEGFGEKTEGLIREGIERLKGDTGRILISQAEQFAEALVDYLRKVDGVKQVEVAGSYRRRKETVGDLDILVTHKKGSPVMDKFADYGEVADVVSHGSTRSTVRLRSGLQVDLRAVPEASYGAAMHYFTGSKAHNIAVRKIGVKRGLKINEYGVFKGDERIAGRTEKEVFEQVGLPFIEPELREDRGEIEAAQEGRLPKLITLDDIRGELHAHTTATDGHDTIEAMVEAARERGYAYIAITDHSRHVTVAKGLNPKRLRKELREIDKLRERFDDITILKAIELDILEDGTLDLPDKALDELDLTVCSVHYKFNLPRDQQTERIIRAMDNPHFNILAHPSGRLINERAPYEVDIERIIHAAKERGCFLELNAQPTRLDLTDTDCKLAKDVGVKIAISTDAHHTTDLAHMRFGIGQARRGWLEPGDVINTYPLAKLKRLLSR
jgi:DNA polymerase (family 10)